jgi:hypothetical protein
MVTSQDAARPMTFGRKHFAEQSGPGKIFTVRADLYFLKLLALVRCFLLKGFIEAANADGW